MHHGWVIGLRLVQHTSMLVAQHKAAAQGAELLAMAAQPLKVQQLHIDSKM